MWPENLRLPPEHRAFAGEHFVDQPPRARLRGGHRRAPGRVNEDSARLEA